MLALEAGESIVVETGEEEILTLPLEGSWVRGCGEQRFDLAGRKGVFEAVTDFAYVGRHVEVELASVNGGRIALAGVCVKCGTCRLVMCRRTRSPSRCAVRGRVRARLTTSASRGTLEADHLIVREVLTPAGNWSSYPPHKHDEDRVPNADGGKDWTTSRWRMAVPARVYSDAIHYQSLLEGGCFRSELDLATQLNIPKSSFYDLMTFTKIPLDIIKLIPNIHKISVNFALTMVAIIKNHPELNDILLQIAPKIGVSITSPAKLHNEIKQLSGQQVNATTNSNNKINVIGKGGANLFTIRYDSNGAPCFVLHRTSRAVIDIDQLSEHIKNFIDAKIEEKYSKTNG